MPNSIKIKLSELSEREKEFLSEYQKLYVECHHENDDFKVALRVLSRGFKDIDTINLEKKLKEIIKEESIFNKFDSTKYDISTDFLELIKKDISFPKLKLKFSTGGTDIEFATFKVRGNYIISSGSDSIIRIFKYNPEKNDIYFIKEILSGNLYDLYQEKYLFYSIDNRLIVSNLVTNNILTMKDFSEKIKSIDLKDDKIFISLMNISQSLIIENDKIIVDLASPRLSNLFSQTMDPYYIPNSEEHYISINNKAITFYVKEKLQLPQGGILINNIPNYLLKIINENKEKKSVKYYKFDNYLNIIYSDTKNDYLKTFKCEKEKVTLLFEMFCASKLNAELKEIPKDMEIHVFEDAFIIFKQNKVYGTPNWKDYVQFVEGLEIKEYSAWESYYENAWSFDLFDLL